MQAVTRATLTIQERASFSLKGLTAVSLHCEQFVKSLSTSAITLGCGGTPGGCHVTR